MANCQRSSKEKARKVEEEETGICERKRSKGKKAIVQRSHRHAFAVKEVDGEEEEEELVNNSASFVHLQDAGIRIDGRSQNAIKFEIMASPGPWPCASLDAVAYPVCTSSSAPWVHRVLARH